MTYRFDPHQSPAKQIQRIAREQLASALHAAQQLEQQEAIHQIRKHCKKMRALVRLVQKTNRHTERLYPVENAHYRSVAQTLSGSRDAVSLYDALTKQLAATQFPATAAALKARIDTSGAGAALAQAQQLLVQGQRQVECWELFGLTTRDLKRGYARSYHRAYRAMQQAFAREDGESFHTLRKRIKDQWYHTRLLQELKPQKIGGRRTRLKLLASALGDWRDLHLLCRFLATHKQALGAEEERELIPLLDQAQQRMQELRRSIGRECEQLFAHDKWREQRKHSHPRPIDAAD
ncbi:CHAD domain-containing protein [Microbulbifer bruguierae]|uniref:CHAD domain-containing protein n=1 Tax=Microbulbifer bruguierae TaxID=3029061 RepID=A0ABY8N9G7_9GAMM|nr:CHAD domain-containing protein [Microbulbifer bruguierae]WGL15518.1 CHAD domain-containing protein [Microbulbifer bruguierae]